MANTKDVADGTVSQSYYSDLLHTPHSDAFVLSRKERLILELYDQQQELQLECTLLQAHHEGRQAQRDQVPNDVSEEHVTAAEQEALEARAEFLIRTKMTQNVAMTHPILKAVHGGSDVGHFEQGLSPLITERDVVSMLHNSLSSKLSSNLSSLSAAEKDNIIANEKNKELAQTLLQLAAATKAQSAEEIADPKLQGQIQQLENQVRDARRKYKLLKGLTSGIIVGSGINWAADEELRELVMDDEEEIG